MKKQLCFLLCLTLIFSSISLCFAADATWSTTDQTNLSNAASRLSTIISTLNTTNSTLNTISNRVQNIYNALFDDNHSVAYWTSAISSWMSPIFNAITNVPVDLSTIIGALGYFDTNNTYHPYLIGIENLSKALTHYYSSGSTEARLNNAHVSLMGTNGVYTYSYVDTNNTKLTVNRQWFDGTPIGNLGVMLRSLNDSFANSHFLTWNAAYTGYNTTQNATNWGNLGTSTFTPSSMTDGIFKWLSAIQTPVARLSYVLASDERIEAQEAAAANEEAVVDNFIDSSGNGSTSPSDIGSVSNLSSGYKQNFGSDASVSGIFNIFDSNNMSWFSQETKNQLDTTSPTRLTKGSVSETPLLDKQIDEIYDALGVKKP